MSESFADGLIVGADLELLLATVLCLFEILRTAPAYLETDLATNKLGQKKVLLLCLYTD